MPDLGIVAQDTVSKSGIYMSQAVLQWCKTWTAEVSECKENFNLTQDIDEDETEEEEEEDDLIQKILRAR